MKIFRYLIIGLFIILFLNGCYEEGNLDYFFSGNYDQAIENYKKIQDKPTVGPLYTFFIGMSYYEKNDPQHAIFYFNKAIKAIETCKDCWTLGTLSAWYFWLGRAYFDTHNYEKAIENFSAASYIAEENPVPPDNIPEWRRIYSIVPRKSLCLYWLGQAYLWKGEYQKALDSLNESLKLNPEGSADVFMVLALTYEKMDKLKEALASANRAIELEPQNAIGYYILGDIQERLGQKSEAIKSYKKSMELFPNATNPYQAIANIYFRDYENYEGAINILRKALEVDRNNFETLLLLSKAHLYAGSYLEASDLLTKVIEMTTTSDIGVRIEIGDDGYPVVVDITKSGPADKAGIKVGDKILEINGQSTKGWDLNKVAQNVKGPEGTAVKLTIERKGAKSPLEFTVPREMKTTHKKATAFAMRAFAYRELGKKEEYLKDAEQAYSLNPNDSWAKSAYALMLIDKGAYDDALKILSTIKDSLFDRILEATAYAKAGDIKNAIRVYQELPEDYLITRSKFYQSYIAFLQNLLEPYKEQKLQVARDLEGKGQYKEAIKEYAEYLKLADEKEAKEVRAHIAELMIRYPHLFALTEEARKAVIRAETYTSGGKFEEAIEEYKKALRDSPFFPALYKALALNYAQLKQYKKAIKNMNIYLELYPDAPDARAAKDEIYRWEFLMEKGE